MTWYALDDVGDAVDATRRFLTPFDRVRWLRLAVVMFFVGGSALSLNFPSLPGGDTDPSPGPEPGPEPAPGQPVPGELAPELTPELLTLLVGVLVFALVLFLGYAIAAAIMEFVFVEALRREEVRLKSYFLRHWRRGVRLFAFRFAVQLLAAALFAGLVLGVGAAVGGWPPTQWDAGVAFSLLGIGLPALGVGAILFGNFLGFTTMFVVPVMLLEGRGVLSAWRRFWGTLRAQWTQYLVYAVIGFLLAIAIGIASGIISLLAMIVLAIPFAIVGIPVVVVLGFEGVGGVVVLFLAVLFVVVMFVVGLLVQVPFQTFLRYHALLVLGDTNDAFDVVPRARNAVRSGDDTGPGGAPAGSDDGPDAGSSGTGAPGADGGDDWGSDRNGESAGWDSDGDDWNVDRSDEGWDTDGDDRR